MNNHMPKLAGYMFASLVVFGLPAVLTADSWMPLLISSEGKGIDDLWLGMLYGSIAILAIVTGAMLYSLVHFRARPGEDLDGAHLHGHHRLEMFWIVVPAIIVTGVSVISGFMLVDMEKPANAAQIEELRLKVSDSEGGERDRAVDDLRKEELRWDRACDFLRDDEWNDGKAPSDEVAGNIPSKDDALVVQVDGFQFGWSYRYPQYDLHQVSELTLEKDRLTLFCMEARDVLHSFWVPEARLKQDVVPGVTTRTQWTPTKVVEVPEDPTPGPGTIEVVCAELCGNGHNAMRGLVRVVDRGDFDDWADDQAKEEKELAEASASQDTAGGADTSDDADEHSPTSTEH